MRDMKLTTTERTEDFPLFLDTLEGQGFYEALLRCDSCGNSVVGAKQFHSYIANVANNLPNPARELVGKLSQDQTRKGIMRSLLEYTNRTVRAKKLLVRERAASEARLKYLEAQTQAFQQSLTYAEHRWA